MKLGNHKKTEWQIHTSEVNKAIVLEPISSAWKLSLSHSKGRLKAKVLWRQMYGLL